MPRTATTTPAKVTTKAKAARVAKADRLAAAAPAPEVTPVPEGYGDTDPDLAEAFVAEEAPAPAVRRGRKTAAERKTADLPAIAKAAAAKRAGRKTAAERKAAGTVSGPLDVTPGVVPAEAAKAAPKPKAAPSHEVGSPEWKALEAEVLAVWDGGAGKDAAAALLVAAHKAGAPIKPLDVLARQGKTRGLAAAWWTAWKQEPEYRARAAKPAEA